MSDLIKKLENSIENLKEKKCKLFFFVQDTKGNGRASVSYIYNLALTLKNAGYNSIILHEKSDYFGVFFIRNTNEMLFEKDISSNSYKINSTIQVDLEKIAMGCRIGRGQLKNECYLCR
jgi:hypothetical protein